MDFRLQPPPAAKPPDRMPVMLGETNEKSLIPADNRENAAITPIQE
jgi:hypothetical protein